MTELTDGPSRLELQMLRILWQKDAPLSADQVRKLLNARKGQRQLAYSSVITVLNIMVEKGYAAREKDGRAFVYTPILRQESVTKQLFRDLADRMFDGSSKAMALEMLGDADMDADELRDIQKLINKRKRELRK